MKASPYSYEHLAPAKRRQFELLGLFTSHLPPHSACVLERLVLVLGAGDREAFLCVISQFRATWAGCLLWASPISRRMFTTGSIFLRFCSPKVLPYAARGPRAYLHLGHTCR